MSALREMPVVSHACRAAGISRSTAYAYRKRSHQQFRKAWDDALEEGIDRLEEKAWSEATKDNGDRAMIMFLLKSLRPSRYREGAQGNLARTPIRVTLKQVPGRKDSDP